MDSKITQLLRNTIGAGFLAVMDTGEIRRARLDFVQHKESIVLGPKIEIYSTLPEFPTPAQGQRWVLQSREGDGDWVTKTIEIEVRRVESTLVVDTDESCWSTDRFTERGVGGGFGTSGRERFLLLDQHHG